MDAMQLTSIKDQLTLRKEKLTRVVNQVPDQPGFTDLLKQVDKALEKIEHKSYGICEVCHDKVEEDRLFIDPLVTVCLGCLDEAQQHALENDLEFAAKIQRNLLPINNQSLNGWEFSYHYSPAGPVSGDFTDIIPLNDKTVIFTIGDVSGKGISASLMMSHLHGLIHSLLSFGLPVNEIIEKANRLFSQSTLNTNYATMVAGKAYADGTIEITVAGHNPPLLVKNGDIESVSATGVPVGLFGETQYGLNKFKLGKGDTLLLYTDGLTESSINEIEYGEERVIEQLSKSNGEAPKKFVESLINNHKSWLNNSKPIDDITVLAVKRMI